MGLGLQRFRRRVSVGVDFGHSSEVRMKKKGKVLTPAEQLQQSRDAKDAYKRGLAPQGGGVGKSREVAKFKFDGTWDKGKLTRILEDMPPADFRPEWRVERFPAGDEYTPVPSPRRVGRRGGYFYDEAGELTPEDIIKLMELGKVMPTTTSTSTTGTRTPEVLSPIQEWCKNWIKNNAKLQEQLS